MNRRTFLVTASLAAAARGQSPQAPPVPDAFKNLKPMLDGVVPISDDERRTRLEKARGLMRQNKLDAVFMEGGTSLYYFTGTRFSTGDRLFGLLLPARGEPLWIVPAADEARARQAMRLYTEARVWAETENPYQRLAQALKDRGGAGRIGLEERVRFAVFDGLRQAAPAVVVASADPVTAGCRVIKSPAELALMQRANDITLACLQGRVRHLHEGMTQRDLAANVVCRIPRARRRRRRHGHLRQVHRFPPRQHPAAETARRRHGAGGRRLHVDGYQSDITRTVVFGKPTARQREIWNLERKAQDAALAAAQAGARPANPWTPPRAR